MVLSCLKQCRPLVGFLCADHLMAAACTPPRRTRVNVRLCVYFTKGMDGILESVACMERLPWTAMQLRTGDSSPDLTAFKACLLPVRMYVQEILPICISLRRLSTATCFTHIVCKSSYHSWTCHYMRYDLACASIAYSVPKKSL